MRLELAVFDWADRWHVVVIEVGEAGNRKHARRKYLYSHTYEGMPPLRGWDALDVLQETLRDLIDRRPPEQPRSGPGAPSGGHGGEPSTLT